MTGLSERAIGLAGRVLGEERPRDLQQVALVMLDGTEITRHAPPHARAPARSTI